MKTKVIIDSQAALDFLKEQKGEIKKQKDLAEEMGISEQTLINWKTKAPNVVYDLLKIKEVTGVPLDIIIKEVAV